MPAFVLWYGLASLELLHCMDRVGDMGFGDLALCAEAGMLVCISTA